MLSPEEGDAFFLQLLHGLLRNLKPLQQPGEQQLQDSPLREASKDVLAATCKLLGPEEYLKQVLQSAGGLTSQAAAVDPSALEVCARFKHYSDVCLNSHYLQLMCRQLQVIVIITLAHASVACCLHGFHRYMHFAPLLCTFIYKVICGAVHLSFMNVQSLL